MSPQDYLTSKKKLELEAELNELKTVRRKEIIDSLEWAKSFGDLSENAEYSQAREDQSKCEARISELEGILQNALITEACATQGVIDICSNVTVKKVSGETLDFNIVGSIEEVNLAEGKISHESPVGLALIGKKEGDRILVKTPKGEVEYKILKVS